jgi:hypothetical protein
MRLLKSAGPLATETDGSSRTRLRIVRTGKAKGTCVLNLKMRLEVPDKVAPPVIPPPAASSVTVSFLRIG